MALETGTNVGDLVATNPAATDQKSQGDDHIRLVKTALKQSFAGYTGAILVTGTNGGVANTYTLTPATALLAYTSPMLVEFIPGANNTGASTINISGLGAKSIKTVAGDPLVADDLVAGKVYVAAYDGTNFNLLAITKKYVDTLSFSAALPNQSGQSGKFVTTNGATASWADVLPTQSGHASQYLKTDGSTAAWDALTSSDIDFSGGIAMGGVITSNVTALSGTTIDVSTSSYQTKSISGNTTFVFSGATASKGQGFFLKLTISSAAVPTWPASVIWGGGVAPTLGNGIHVLVFVTFDGGTSWSGAVMQKAAA